METVLTGWFVGFVLGMRHALEPDHLTAVMTLVSGRGGARRALWLGACWGMGHSLSLFAVGMLLALLQAHLPARVADAFELAVAVMLVVLGIRAVAGAFGGPAPPRVHDHLQPRLATRSLFIGLVHGLAGSGALTTLVLAELPSTPARLGYIALFGCGSMLGMALLSGLVGWPLARFGRSRRVAAGLALTTGAISVVFGVAWGIHVLNTGTRG